tara:strand:+ start:1034 stop:1498 length:465 start_codon:yes stop_codon:yes gene_type:complete
METRNILKEYDKSILCIETAAKNGLRVLPANNGADITIDLLTSDHELTKDQKENAVLVKEMLKKNKEALKMVTSDKETLIKKLIEAHRALSDANKGVMVLLDRVDRLQNIWETMHPDIKDCYFNYNEGCPDDAVVYCNPCARKRGWTGKLTKKW